MSDYYTLNADHSVTPVDYIGDALNQDRRIGRDTVKGYDVSTVFLGINHNQSFNGPPLLFETMVFQGSHTDLHRQRYSTYKQAVDGHKQVIDFIKLGLLPKEKEV